MERYKIIETVGDGSYGTVYKAATRANGEIVAIKKMKKKFYSWEECLALREIKSLRKLTHNNIVKLKEVIRVNDQLHMVFDFLDQDVYQLMKDRTQPFPQTKIRSILLQVFQGLAYIHKHGFFHRDLKPENLMVHGDLCKIADFGLAREIRSRPPFTDYVSTRWYRAPQIVLRSTSYNYQSDIFAMGCIMAELYNLRPLAPGTNENDQLVKLCMVLGTPSMADWSEGYKLANSAGLRFPQAQPVEMKNIIPHACPEAWSLLAQLLSWDPQKRPSAAQCLNHPYFTNYSSTTRNPTSGLEQRESRANSSLRRTNNKWSQGSSRIGGNSSKGRWDMKPAARDIQLPKLREVPEQGYSRVQRNKPESKQQNETHFPSINPSLNRDLPSIRRAMDPIQKYQQDSMIRQVGGYNRGYLDRGPRYPGLGGIREGSGGKLPPMMGGMSGVGNSIMGSRAPARNLAKGSILPALGRHRIVS